MKDIFEMLNDVPVEDSEYSELPVDDLERRRVKDAVRLHIEEERAMEQGRIAKKNRKRMTAAVACTAAVIVGISGLGMAFPTYAKEIPVVGDIFRYLDNGRTGQYDRYKESAADIDMTKEAEEISVTLNDGIYDGTTLTLTYTVKTGMNMGEMSDLDTEIDFARSLGINGWGGSSSLKKVEEGVYVGMNTYTMHSGSSESFDVVPFTWKVKGMNYADADGNYDSTKNLKCNLNFNVSLSAVAGEPKSLSATVREPEKGLTLTMAEINETKVNTILKYKLQVSADIGNNLQINWEIKDDLGNIYEDSDLGATGREDAGIWNAEHTMSVGTIAPEAKRLILTPTVSYAEPSEDGQIMGGGVSIDEDGKETEIKDVPRSWSKAYTTNPGTIEIAL